MSKDIPSILVWYIYGECETIERHSLWTTLGDICTYAGQQDWLVVDDLNEIREPNRRGDK